MAVRAASGWAAVVALLLLAGCGAPGWKAAEALGPGAVVRDAAGCGDRWYAAGAILGPGDATRPAAWVSTDGRAWEDVPFRPLPGSLYGPQDLISSVACAGGRVVMVGARPGGAHGIPRVSTWRLSDGAMTEVAAPFETYGGDTAVNVGHVAAGTGGFVITGNRSSGAAIWLSPDGAAFRLLEGAPGLASDSTHRTVARDAAPMPDGRWAIVGGIAPRAGADQAPAVWLTRDGSTFTRAEVPASGGFDELQRVVRLGDDLVAAGPRGSALGAWREHAGTWSEQGTFPGTNVDALTVAHGDLVAVAGAKLWRSTDRGHSWKALAAPSGAVAPMTVAGRGDTVLLGSGGRTWTAAGR